MLLKMRGRLLKTLSLFSFLSMIPSLGFGALSVEKLKLAREASESAGTPAARAAFDAEAKAFSEAIAFSTFQAQSRSKLPGAFEPYFELGFHTFRVNNDRLKNFTTSTSGETPDFFHGLFLKGGTGLPFGINIEGGLSQITNDHKSTSLYATISGQVLDFANMVYIDLVPSMTVSASILRTVAGPSLYNFSGQTTIGAYHRQSLSQFGLIIQYSYTMLVALSPSIGNHFIRYGAMSNLPIYDGLFLKTEVFYPSMSASLSAGYQF